MKKAKSVMSEEKLDKLLNGLADATAEQVRPGLAEEIKQRIPDRLRPHRSRMDTINIVIDLRVSKLAAAAAIILTMFLFAGVIGGRDRADSSILESSKQVVKYWLRGGSADKSEMLTGVYSLYGYLTEQGKDVTYYGDAAESRDANALLLQWKLSEGSYKVIFGDLRIETVSAEKLIKLQGRMLQKKAE